MTNFARTIYALVDTIPRGKVTTYGELAVRAGCPRASRAVGRILHNNPNPYVTPCHRVVNREGRLAPAYAFGGLGMQRALLEEEGVTVRADDTVDLALYGGAFDSPE